jgi:hypothetical protein
MGVRSLSTGVLIAGIVALATVFASSAGGAPNGAAAPAVAETFTATLSGAQEVPPVPTAGTGTAIVQLNEAETMITVDVSFSNLSSNANGAHIHDAPPGVNGPIIFGLTGVPAATSGTVPQQSFSITAAQVAALRAGNYYVNVHSDLYPGGEIRGQLGPAPTAVRIVGAAAVRTPRGVLVRWRTANEARTLGFNVYRQQYGKLVKLNRAMIRSSAGAARGAAYSWLDRGARAQRGALKYRLQVVNLNGTRAWLASASVAR